MISTTAEMRFNGKIRGPLRSSGYARLLHLKQTSPRLLDGMD